MSSTPPSGEKMLGAALSVRDAVAAALDDGAPLPETARADLAWLVMALEFWRGELDTLARLWGRRLARHRDRTDAEAWRKGKMTDA